MGIRSYHKENMMHIWVNADFDGTRGWSKCIRCGHRTHEPQQPAPAPVLLPAADMLVSYPPMTCDQVCEKRAEATTRKIRKLLEAETPVVALLIMRRLADMVAADANYLEVSHGEG